MPSPETPVDIDAFVQELDAIRADLDAERGPRCVAHLKKMERWGRAMTALGYATAWIAPNPISVLALSLGRTYRWVLVAHPVSHKAYDKIDGAPERLTSRGFAKGWRRMVDWFDWIDPEAWHEEHDIQHHYKLGEEGDPDVVQDNLPWFRNPKVPTALKLVFGTLYAATWKATYYAPNVLEALHHTQARRKARKSGQDTPPEPWSPSPLHPSGRRLWLRNVLPYVGATFGLIPALFLPFGTAMAGSVLANSLMAEAVTNLHTFIVITTNPCGEDVPVFETSTKSRAEFFVRQITGSVNFKTGGDFNDAMHGWLNYQIEHHLWPDMTLRQYQLAQPRVQAACEKYGVPYIQESVWTRLRKSLEIMLGKTTQRPSTLAITAGNTAAEPLG